MSETVYLCLLKQIDNKLICMKLGELIRILPQKQILRGGKIIHRPGIEPAPPAWQASILQDRLLQDREPKVRGGRKKFFPTLGPFFYFFAPSLNW